MMDDWNVNIYPKQCESSDDLNLYTRKSHRSKPIASKLSAIFVVYSLAITFYIIILT